MDANHLKTQISQTFEALTEQMETINLNQGRIPQIEIDLIMDNIRELYSAFKDLDRLNNPYAKTREAENMPPIPQSLPPQPKPEEPPLREFAFREKISMGSFNIEKEEPNEVEILPVTDVEPIVESTPEAVFIPEKPIERIEVRNEEKTIEQVVQVKEIPVQAEPEIRLVRPSGDLFSMTGSPSISDTYKDEKKTLNDRLNADTTDRSISSRLSQNQISDIKTAIGINEKFQFINELFGGNMQEYTNGMSQLNQFKNFAEAVSFIDILKFKYNWDMNADAYRKLMEILRRRYPS